MVVGIINTQMNANIFSSTNVTHISNECTTFPPRSKSHSERSANFNSEIEFSRAQGPTLHAANSSFTPYVFYRRLCRVLSLRVVVRHGAAVVRTIYRPRLSPYVSVNNRVKPIQNLRSKDLEIQVYLSVYGIRKSKPFASSNPVRRAAGNKRRISRCRTTTGTGIKNKLYCTSAVHCSGAVALNSRVYVSRLMPLTPA